MQLLEPYSEEVKSIEPGAVYEHYKGKRYRVIGVGRHSESLEEVVIYQALYGDGDLWVRPLKMFLSSVVVDGQQLPRFEKNALNG